MKLPDTRVWITGASSGLGAAMARYASAHGAHVILSARRRSELEAVAASCAEPHRTTVLPFDLTEPESFVDVVARAGEVDILINNGGISQRSFALDTSPEVTRRIMETNFFGHVELTRLVAPAMLRRRRGQLVAVSSVVGYLGIPKRATYAASKHALHGYYDSLGYELAGSGVAITLICPGFIHTDISRNATTADGTPLGTMDPGQAKGMNADDFARKAWHGIERERREVYIGGTETYGIYLKRYVPRVLDWVVRRSVTS